jgi:hypothetical protein
VHRRTAIRDLAYVHNAKPGLGVELLWGREGAAR